MEEEVDKSISTIQKTSFEDIEREEQIPSFTADLSKSNS